MTNRGHIEPRTDLSRKQGVGRVVFRLEPGHPVVWAKFSHLSGLRCSGDEVIPTLEFIATLSAALFAGAALYINVAEHPARMTLETRIAALQWAPSYKRATWLQAPLAIVSFFAGTAVWLYGGGVGWLIAAVVIGAVVPFTFLIIMPTNNRLLAPGRDLSSDETRELLGRWAHLHAVRTFLSLVGAATYLGMIVSS